jgi:GSH-dependent disulfide-bond oxidoreductase
VHASDASSAPTGVGCANESGSSATLTDARLDMIDLYFDPTPNAWKVSIMLEECGLPYRLVPVSIRAGHQFAPEFARISPNNRVPAIVDHSPIGGGQPLAIFESGAILLYLAEKTGKFFPKDVAGRYAVIQWLMWQVGGLGPVAGHNGHFLLYAAEKIPYAIERFGRELRRLYSVLDLRLQETNGYIAGDYSVADMACFPWIMVHKKQGLTLADFPGLKRWFAEVRARPLVQKGLAVGGGPSQLARPMSDADRRVLFGAPARPGEQAQ